tara:strand:+ start:156 stop:350 length:195 start_codon:yes stop_codon:yes gene_type:complete
MGGLITARYKGENRMNKFFKKASGVVVKFNKIVHDIKSLEDRFEECDENGVKIKVEVKAKKAKK